MSDFHLPAKNVFSEKEENFKDRIFLRLNTKIKQTLFIEGACSQYHLYIWLEMPQNEECKALIAENEKFIIDCYLSCFGINVGDSEIFLNVYDFKESLISYAYGHAVSGIKSILSREYGSSGYKFLLDYKEIAYVIVCDPNAYKEWSGRAVKINRICYGVLKSYDSYGVIAPEDVRLNILKYSSSDATEMNDLYMINRHNN